MSSTFEGVFPINIVDKNLKEGRISVSGVGQYMKRWYLTLTEKNYYDAVQKIKEVQKDNPEISYRIIKIDSALFDGSKKLEAKSEGFNKNRINLVLKTKNNFQNDILQKEKKIIRWLNVQKNQEESIVIDVLIY